MHKIEKEFKAFITEIYKLNSHKEILDNIINLKLPKSYKFRLKVLYSKVELYNVFDYLTSKEIIKKLSEKSFSYNYETISGRIDKKLVSIPFYLQSLSEYEIGENIQLLISICKSGEWNILKRLIKNNYPKIVPVLLSQSELIKSIKRLREFSGHSVKVKSLSVKESLNGNNGQKIKSIREWTDEDLDDVLNSVLDRRQLINSIDIEYFPEIKGKSYSIPKATCKIRKSGEIEVSGNLHIPLKSVVLELAKVGQDNLRFYSGRGLRESSYKPKPFSINFNKPIFEEIQVVRTFVETIKRYPHSMHSVQHGNPYAHIKLTDIYDFSSYEVWAIPPSHIAILPGLKTTEAAFERIVHYIFDKFREGKVENYGQSNKL